MMGMGSIVGTGVFVSIGIAAGIAGPAVILAVFLAGRWQPEALGDPPHLGLGIFANRE